MSGFTFLLCWLSLAASLVAVTFVGLYFYFNYLEGNDDDHQL